MAQFYFGADTRLADALEGEAVRLNEIIRALMDRAKRSANAQGSDFNLLQTTIMLEQCPFRSGRHA